MTTQSPTGATDKLGRRRPDHLRVDGMALRRLRLLRGRTQAEAAAIGGLARNHWSAIECGLRSGVQPGTAFKLAKGVSPEDASQVQIGALVSEFAQVD